MAPALDVSHSRGVVVARSEGGAATPEEIRGLGAELVELERSLRERLDPVSAVVIDAAGPAFCVAGPSTARTLDAIAGDWSRATAAVAALTAPTVAMVRTDAVGPAFELALACDFRVVAGGARLGSDEGAVGRIPVAGGTQRLARIIGPRRALELLLTGRSVDGAEALGLGLAHAVGADRDDDRALTALLDELRAGAPLALAYLKEAIHAGTDLPLAAGLRLEADLSSLLQTTEDRAEGLRAFREGRAPDFRGI